MHIICIFGSNSQTQHSTQWDETESSGDSVFQYQVKTDTPRLGRNNKMQTNKPIITFKAPHTCFLQTSPSKSHERIMKNTVGSSQNVLLTPQNNPEINSDENMRRTSDVLFIHIYISGFSCSEENKTWDSNDNSLLHICFQERSEHSKYWLQYVYQPEEKRGKCEP